MASSTRIRLIRWLPDIQFSLRTLIAVMTMISVSLAIMRWQFAAGAMAGMDRASVDYFLERLRQSGGPSWSAERGFGFRNVDGHS